MCKPDVSDFYVKEILQSWDIYLVNLNTFERHEVCDMLKA